MAVKVGFMTTLGRNVGDEFIREGIRAILDATGVAYTPLYVDKHDPASLHESSEDEIVVTSDKYWESDVFIQSGAPVYWRLRDDATSLTSEWHQWLWEERILGAPASAAINPDAPRRQNGAREQPSFVNLGAGSCQAWGQDGAFFLEDAGCVDFARRAGARAELTTVRDPVAANLLSALGIDHLALACPAFLAAARHRLDVGPPAGHLGINLMPLGGHFDLAAGFDPARWKRDCQQMVASLRQMRPLVFIAHDVVERDWLKQFAASGERVFLASTWRAYLDLYAGCSLVVANRVHGAVCAAGFGVPGIILGNDTRAQIGCALDLTILQSGQAQPDEIAAAASRLLAERGSQSERLRFKREGDLQKYRDHLLPVMEQAQR